MANTHVEIRFGEKDAFSVICRNYIIATVDAPEGKLHIFCKKMPCRMFVPTGRCGHRPLRRDFDGAER